MIGKNNYDYLARALITVDEAAYSEGDAVVTPKWHSLKFDDLSPPSGEVLISFAIVAADYSFYSDLDNVNLH